MTKESPAESPTPLVDVRDLSIRFKDRTVVDGLNLLIRPGECVALVGESGSGKSVTARSLLNLAGKGAVVSSSRFMIGGEDTSSFSASKWRSLKGAFIGLIMQDALVSLDPLRSIGEEAAETALHHGLIRGKEEARRKVIETLERVGVPDPEIRVEQYAHQLSGGLRQRALIAAALVANPGLIVADEPTTALDASIQRQVLEVLAEAVKKRGIGLLLISHDLTSVADLADWILVMKNGRVVEEGRPSGIFGAPRHIYSRQLIAAVPSADSRGFKLSSSRIEQGADESRVRILRTPLPPRPPIGADVVFDVRNISKTYRLGRKKPPFVAVDAVSFQVRAGEILGLVGESGSGKSTCAKIVLGLLEPDAGSVTLLGAPWSHVSERKRRPLRPRLQYIPQDPLSSFDPRYRVEDIIGEALSPDKRAAGESFMGDLLRQVELGTDFLRKSPGQLSGGERQRVAIARALATNPAIIVCDEPVSALDISTQARIVDLLVELQSRRNTAFLFISHDIGLVHHIADRVLVMKSGAIVEEGDVEKIFLSPTHAYTRSLLKSVRPALTERVWAEKHFA